MKPLFLVGYMGCGKSTLGRKLARRLGVDFIDTDALVEEREGASVADVFRYEGEERFRDAERRVLDEVIAGADEFLRIPMCGMVESLNVSASAAILIYMLSERVRLTVGDWRMDEARQAEVLYRWMMSSVKDAGGILARKFGNRP